MVYIASEKADTGRYYLLLTLTDATNPLLFSSVILPILLLSAPPLPHLNLGPPFFLTPLPQSVIVEVGSTYTLRLSEVVDPDGDTYTVTNTQLPRFTS